MDCISLQISWRTWFLHFATDKVDFVEDTPGATNTLHGTIMVAYQQCEAGDVSSCLTMSCDDTALNISEYL